MNPNYRWLTRATTFLLACFLAQPLLAEDLSIPGSGNPQYMLTILADAFNKQQSLHTVSVPPSTGTAGALRDVEAGTASLGRVGRKLKPEELARGLIYVPIGRDAVVFVAGAGTTIAGLTSRQAADVYTGKITNWQDLGGKPGPIRAIGRE
jgi:phosphate transport system substrate-binding protein